MSKYTESTVNAQSRAIALVCEYNDGSDSDDWTLCDAIITAAYAGNDARVQAGEEPDEIVQLNFATLDEVFTFTRVVMNCVDGAIDSVRDAFLHAPWSESDRHFAFNRKVDANYLMDLMYAMMSTCPDVPDCTPRDPRWLERKW